MPLTDTENNFMERLPIYLGQLDKKVFTTVFEKYYSALCVYAERMVGPDDAKDVIEELFVGLWNRDTALENEMHLKAFLYHTAKNACLNHLKSDQRKHQRNTVYARSMPEVEDSHLLEVTRTELIRELYIAIAELPTQCGKIIHMGYVEGLKNAEIAKKLGLSIQTVKNQKIRGIGLLRKRLPRNLFLAFVALMINLH